MTALILTRRQLEALTELHLSGTVSPRGNASTLAASSTFADRTINALVIARVARRADVLTLTVAPQVHRWVDGAGWWHVAVPDTIDNGAAVARAVIRGEVMAREPYRYPDGNGYHPRVELDIVSVPRDGFAIYREV